MLRVGIVFLLFGTVLALAPLQNEPLGRRSLLAGSGAVPLLWLSDANASVQKEEVSNRMEKDILVLPPPSTASELNGVDNLYYPEFLIGEWNVEQTLISTSAPLGMKFVGGPNADMSIAEKTMVEAQSKVGFPVKFKLNYVRTKWGVAEDRLFNVKSRLDSFAGKNVVSNVLYADVGGSNRKSVISMGGSESDPLQTTFVQFKGPAAQKSFLISHGAEKLSDTEWAGYEVQRSIFALTNQNTAPPITTDVEYIWRLKQQNQDTITGRLRIAEYLNAQQDKLYFEARNRAVSLQDYSLEMRRS